jgi:hypothetical protein
VCVVFCVRACWFARARTVPRDAHNKKKKKTHEQRRRLDADRGVEAPKVGVALRRAAGGARLAQARGAHGAHAPRFRCFRVAFVCARVLSVGAARGAHVFATARDDDDAARHGGRERVLVC